MGDEIVRQLSMSRANRSSMLKESMGMKMSPEDEIQEDDDMMIPDEEDAVESEIVNEDSIDDYQKNQLIKVKVKDLPYQVGSTSYEPTKSGHPKYKLVKTADLAKMFKPNDVLTFEKMPGGNLYRVLSKNERYLLESEDDETDMKCVCGSENIIKEGDDYICDDCGRTIEKEEKVEEATKLSAEAIQIGKRFHALKKAGKYNKAFKVLLSANLSDDEIQAILTASALHENDDEEEKETPVIESKKMKKKRICESYKVGDRFENAGYTWEVIAMKGEYTLVHDVKDVKYQPWVVAWHLKGDSWAQGHYFSDKASAYKYLKQQRGTLLESDDIFPRGKDFDSLSKGDTVKWLIRKDMAVPKVGEWFRVGPHVGKCTAVDSKYVTMLKEDADLEIIEPEKKSTLEKNIIYAIQTPISTAKKPNLDSAIMEAFKK